MCVNSKNYKIKIINCRKHLFSSIKNEFKVVNRKNKISETKKKPLKTNTQTKQQKYLEQEEKLIN